MVRPQPVALHRRSQSASGVLAGRRQTGMRDDADEVLLVIENKDTATAVKRAHSQAPLLPVISDTLSCGTASEGNL
jgi:hypothetical protein